MVADYVICAGGLFFEHGKLSEAHPSTDNEELAKDLWEETLRLLSERKFQMSASSMPRLCISFLSHHHPPPRGSRRSKARRCRRHPTQACWPRPTAQTVQALDRLLHADLRLRYVLPSPVSPAVRVARNSHTFRPRAVYVIVAVAVLLAVLLGVLVRGRYQ